MRTVIERFWEKVRVDDSGCWEWLGGCSRGYGGFDYKNKTVRAHRFCFEQLIGPISIGCEGHHLCHNRRCVNPAHLVVIAHKEHMQQSMLFDVGQNNRNKTHCSQGHPYDANNTYIIPTGGRDCKICRRLRWRKYRKAQHRG